MSVALTLETFDQITAKGIVVIDWWADWCGPCRTFARVFEGASLGYPAIVFGRVDTEIEEDLANRFEVAAIPTLTVFRDGILVFSRAGAVGADALAVLIDHVLGLDMSLIQQSRLDQG